MPAPYVWTGVTIGDAASAKKAFTAPPAY